VSKPRFVAMIANQRSGTHLIRGCVNSHPRAYCPPEPMFHCPPQTDEEMLAFLEQYRGIAPDVVLIDVKYNQITPPVEAWLRGCRVLHLIRRDVRRMFFSRELRRWMAAHPEERKNYHPPEKVPQIPFDRDKFRRFVRDVKQYQACFTPLETTRLYYEDLTENRNVVALPGWAGRILCGLLEIPYHRLYASGVKGAPTDIKDYWQ